MRGPLLGMLVVLLGLAALALAAWAAVVLVALHAAGPALLLVAVGWVGVRLWLGGWARLRAAGREDRSGAA